MSQIDCQKYSARIPERTCAANINIAHKIHAGLARGRSLFIYPNWKIERYMICGKCAKSGLPPEEVGRRFSEGVRPWSRKINQMMDVNPQDVDLDYLYA